MDKCKKFEPNRINIKDGSGLPLFLNLKPIVMIESPYRNGNREENLRYLAWCEYDSATRGEYPIASHGNCTAYHLETEDGRRAGFEWRSRLSSVCDIIAYYADLGMSEGMATAMVNDEKMGKTTLIRRLPPGLISCFIRGDLPPCSMMRVPANPILPSPSKSIM